MQVLDCQLLLVSRGPPAAAVAAADGGEVMLVGEPALEDSELPAGVYGRGRLLVWVYV
jgi:hypothetical protein